MQGKAAEPDFERAAGAIPIIRLSAITIARGNRGSGVGMKAIHCDRNEGYLRGELVGKRV